MKTELGITAHVSFYDERMSPIADYNGVSHLTQTIANTFRSREDQEYGSAPRWVTADTGNIAYTCQAVAAFKGGLDPENVTYVALNSCKYYLTDAGEQLDTKCAAAKYTKNAQATQQFCQPISLLLPSAVQFEIRH